MPYKKRKAPVITYPIKLKPLMNISITPTIRPSPYNPCPSLIFCHQEDKSELRGATPNFLPRLSPKPAQEWLPANFTVHSEYKPIILPYGYFHRLLPL